MDIWEWGFDTKRYEIDGEKGEVTRLEGRIVELEKAEEAEEGEEERKAEKAE